MFDNPQYTKARKEQSLGALLNSMNSSNQQQQKIDLVDREISQKEKIHPKDLIDLLTTDYKNQLLNNQFGAMTGKSPTAYDPSPVMVAIKALQSMMSPASSNADPNALPQGASLGMPSPSGWSTTGGSMAAPAQAAGPSILSKYLQSSAQPSATPVPTGAAPTMQAPQAAAPSQPTQISSGASATSPYARLWRRNP